MAFYKSFEMKAADNGSIEGYFSTYDKTPDSYGDIIEPGAFTETIKAREESGHPFPLCFNHDFSAVIGAVDSVKDTEKGPFISAHFLDTQLAQDVRKMLQSGAIPNERDNQYRIRREDVLAFMQSSEKRSFEIVSSRLSHYLMTAMKINPQKTRQRARRSRSRSMRHQRNRHQPRT